MKKLVLVTGGVRGIGAATSLKFAHHGYDVVLNYRSDQQAANTLTNQIEEIGRAAYSIQADISVEADVLRLFSEVDRIGQLSALINNAGILALQGKLVEFTRHRLEQIFATNVIGLMQCCQQAILRMSTDRGGSGGVIINVGSGASRLGSANEYIDYAASKGAVDSLTTGLANEVAAEGIRVNCVRPGLIYTDIHAAGGEPGRVDRLKSNLPLQRGGTAQEVANAIYFLASDESTYTTGAFLDVTGGR
jgi:NAD(P)-dependent dehydrogenase (short-subunit alcohol dehydrogenase family)